MGAEREQKNYSQTLDTECSSNSNFQTTSTEKQHFQKQIHPTQKEMPEISKMIVSL